MATKNRIDSLTIRGFQSIRELEDFKLNDINVLIGPNGAGKSNFVTYFRMLGELVEKRLQVWVSKRGGADRLLTFGVKETQELFSHLQFGDNGYQFRLVPADDGGFVFAEESFYQKGSGHLTIGTDDEVTINGDGEWLEVGNDIVKHNLGEGNIEARIREKATYTISREVYQSIYSWKVFHFHDTSDTAGVKRSASVDDADYLRSDASNLAAYLYKMRRRYPDTYNQIRKTVQLAIPFFDDFVLEPQTLNGDDQQIRLLWRQRDSDYPMWPTQLSDGSIRFICLATALLQPDPPSTIIIDEPELGLHPYAITLLGSLMRSASTQMQIVVSTQSVPLLNEFTIEDLIVVEREEGVSVFKRLNEADFQMWLEDYSIGQLWEKNILGGRP